MKRKVSFKKLSTFDKEYKTKKLRNECDTCINDYAERGTLWECTHCGKNHKNWKPKKLVKSCENCGYGKLLNRTGNPLKCIRCQDKFLKYWEPIKQEKPEPEIIVYYCSGMSIHQYMNKKCKVRVCTYKTKECNIQFKLIKIGR
jgi:hypothetical protein